MLHITQTPLTHVAYILTDRKSAGQTAWPQQPLPIKLSFLEEQLQTHRISFARG